MARIYYNTGPAGSDFSYLHLIKISSGRAGLLIRGNDKEIILNREQIVDLISKLQIILGVKPDEPPVMTGEL